MASPRMHVGMPGNIANIEDSRPGDRYWRAAARLLEAENREQILSVLLEEVVALGFFRVLVAGMDFGSGEIPAWASVNISPSMANRFRTLLSAADGPLAGVLHSLRPAVLPSGPTRKPLYCHPIFFRARARCREAEGQRPRRCLAVENYRGRRRLRRAEQVCSTCGMRGYSALVIVELSKVTNERDLARLRTLVNLADRHLAHLFKIEHYYDRLVEMNAMLTRMQTAAGPVSDQAILGADAEVRTQYERLRRAEEVVRQERDRLNLIIENVGDPIVVCDSGAKPVLLDPLAAELFGSERDSSRDPHRIHNHAKFDTYISSFTFSFSDRESGPLRLYNPSTRSEVEFDARSGKIYDERGRVAYTVTVLRDLTAVRKVEQLKVERRMLEIEKFAATGRLAGTIAHEVNNPMEAIKNAIYLLSGKVSPEAAPVYDILKSETERVARIVRQMLGLYRNTQQAGSVDVNGVVEDTLLLFSRQLQQVSIQVKTKLATLPMAVGSGDQLRQVLSNLVVNARDSMEKGGTLHVRTSFVRGSSDSLHALIRVLVADTGSGIPPALQDSIFEPFVSTKGAKGTGLGLWIVKGIIENHGGKIRVRSRVGKGTVFQLDLPAVR